MNYRLIVRNFLLSILFLLCLHCAARYFGHVLYPKMEFGMGSTDGTPVSEDYAVYYFGKTERYTVDTIFIGNSHQFCSVDVNLLNREYGWNSILLTSRSQNLKLSYYAILEALEFQRPKTIVLETCAAVDCGEEPDTLAKTSFFDYMPNSSRTKWDAVKAVGDSPIWYYYPVTALHSNWGDVRLRDFKLIPKLPVGERYVYTIPNCTPLEKWEVIPSEQNAPLREESVRWLQKIADICRENDLELILYTAPYQTSDQDQAEYNAIADFAEENGLRYLNLMYDMDAMGLDFSTDFMDPGHLNMLGQEKLTRYFAEQLEEILS